MTDDEIEIEKVTTPRGNARSMTTLKPYNVNVSYGDSLSPPGTGSDWFGPRQPMLPVAPPEVAGRQFDYPVGFNLATQPRTYEPIDFQTLRNLSEAYDPLRVVIERRKDQLCRIPWDIRLKHEDTSKKRPASAELLSRNRAVISDVKQFFRHPEPNLNFRSWLRALVEDLLVLDAPTLYCERDHAGSLTGLSLVDGATVRPIIDDMGRQPRPITNWDGSAFNWCGSEINVSNYLQMGCRIVDSSLYVPAYSQTLKGLPAVHYTVWDLLQKPLNVRTNSVFGRSPVEQIATTINIAMRRSFAQLEYFREGNQPDAVYGLPPNFGPDQVQRLQDWWDSMHSGNWANRRKMKFLPAGSANAYTPLKEPPLTGALDQWLVRVVCAALSYPVSAFVSLSNRSIAEQHEKTAEEEGLEPLKAWFADWANTIIEREFSDEIEFCWAEEQVVDQKIQAEVLSTYVSNGILSINQAREKIGEQPDPNPAASQLMVKTNTGFAPIGGDTQGD